MDSPCNRCKRQGISLYLVSYAAVPKQAATGRPVLGGQFGGGVTDKVLAESAYVLRGLEPGYVYLLCGSAWRGYLIDSAGYPRYYPDLRLEDMPDAVPAESAVVQCERQGKNHTGVEAISIEHPDLIKGTVYIAYSRHKWTKAVRKEIAKNPGDHMQPVANLDGKPFAHAEVASVENLRKWVVDFDQAAVNAINRHLPEGARVIDRSTKAEGIAKAMLACSGELKAPGLIMALHDNIGVTAMLNRYRNAVAEQALLLDEKTSKAQREDMVVAGVIEDLREGIEKNKGDWPRHFRRLDSGRFEVAKKALVQRRELAKKVDALSADYVQWMTYARTKAAFAKTFDCSVRSGGLALEEWFAACTVGSGTTVAERTKVWQPWLDKPPEDDDNLLWQAASAGDKTVLPYLAWEKLDKTFDLSKGSKDLFKETPWYEHLQETLAARRQRLDQRRAYTLATEKIAQTLAAQLIELRRRDPKKFMRAAGQMATVLMVRGDFVALPKTITARMSQYLRWQQERWLGKPTVKTPLRIEPAPTRNTGGRVDPSKIANDEVRREVQSLHGALMVDLSGRDGVLAFTTWAAVRLEPGEAPNEALQKVARQLKLLPSDFTVSGDFKINPLSEDALNLRSVRLDRAFSVGTAFFQLIALCKTGDELTDELKKGKDADSLKVNSGVAGILGACASIIAAGMEVKAAGNILAAGGVASTGSKWLLGGAAGIGLIVGVTDTYFLWKQADKLSTEGDKDASLWTRAAATATGISAVFAFIAGAGSVFLGLTGVGLIVVVAIAVLAAVVAMISSFIGAEKTDTELEKWLDRCRFGKRERADSKSPYKDRDEELLGLRSALYAVTVSIRHMLEAGTLRAFYKAATPFYAPDTQLLLEVWGRDPWGKDHLLTHVDLAGQTALPKDHTDRRAVPVSELSLKLNDKTLILEGEILVRQPPQNLYRDDKTGCQYITVGSVSKNVSDVLYIQSMRIALKYVPDAKTWPDFVVEAKA